MRAAVTGSACGSRLSAPSSQLCGPFAAVLYCPVVVCFVWIARRSRDELGPVVIVEAVKASRS